MVNLRFAIFLAFYLITPISFAGESIWINDFSFKKSLEYLESKLISNGNHCSKCLTNVWKGRSQCPRSIAPTINEVVRFRKRVRGGDMKSIVLFLKGRNCFGVGDDEDMVTYIGEAFDKDPKNILDIFLKQKIPVSEFAHIVEVTPLSTIDHFDQQLKVLEQRKSILQGIDDRKYLDLRKVGLRALKESIQETNRALKAFGSKDKEN